MCTVLLHGASGALCALEEGGWNQRGTGGDRVHHTLLLLFLVSNTSDDASTSLGPRCRISLLFEQGCSCNLVFYVKIK